VSDTSIGFTVETVTRHRNVQAAEEATPGLKNGRNAYSGKTTDRFPLLQSAEAPEKSTLKARNFSLNVSLRMADAA
jgi:hypothetical protein